MAAVLVAEAHWRALQVICDETSVHYNGLQQAARSLRCILSARSYRRLRALDAAFSITRHITAQIIAEFVRDLRAGMDFVGPKPCVGPSMTSVSHDVTGGECSGISSEDSGVI